MALSELERAKAAQDHAIDDARARAQAIELVESVGNGKITASELVDALSAGSLEKIGEKAGAHLQVVSMPEYAPDFSVYLPDPKNDTRSAMMEAIREQRAHVTIQARAVDGLMESVKLQPYEAKAYFSSTDHSLQRQFLNERVVTRRWNVAREGARKLSEGLKITAQEEAYLFGFGMLQEAENREPIADGGYSVSKSMSLRENATTLLERDMNSEYDAKRLREDLFDTLGFAPVAMSTYNTTAPYLDYELLPNWGYGTAQQTIISDVWDMQAKSEYAFRHDPIGKKGVHVIRDFTLGRGVEIKCKSDKLQVVVDEFWSRNKMKNRLKQWVVVSSKLGEIFLRKYPIGQGRLKITSTRPDTIVEIITDSEDFDDVFSYVQAFQTRIITYMDNAPARAEPHYIFRYIPAKEIMHHKLNCDDYDIRGRSDLFCALPWMKAMRDYLYTVVQKEQTAAAYLFDYTVDGGPADIARVQAALPKGKVDPGAYQIHNKKLEIGVVKADPKNTIGNNSPYEGLLNHCAIAIEIPREYLGSGSRSTRANTLVATDPTTKRFDERQDWTGDVLNDVIGAVIDEAIRFDPTLAKEDRDFRAVFPATMRADSVQRMKGIERGRAAGYLSHETGASLYYAEMELEDINYDDEIDKLKAEVDDPFKSTIPHDEMNVFNAAYLAKHQQASGPTPSMHKDGTPQGDIGGGGPADGAQDQSPGSATGAAQIASDQGSSAGA